VAAEAEGRAIRERIAILHAASRPSEFGYRNDSVPVSMMCARSVSRSSMALHNRAFGNTCGHSENGRFVVTTTAAFSARSAITWKSSSAPASANGT